MKKILFKIQTTKAYCRNNLNRPIFYKVEFIDKNLPGKTLMTNSTEHIGEKLTSILHGMF